EPGEEAPPLPVTPPPKATNETIAECARVLRSREPTVLLVSGAALLPENLPVAYRIATATGVRLMAPTFNARIARGRGRPPIEIVPYPVDELIVLVQGPKHLVVSGD